MKIQITCTLHKCDKVVQIFDTEKPVNRLRTPSHPRKGEDIITPLFLMAMQDAKDVGVLHNISFREVLRFYAIELALHEEQLQYIMDFGA